MEMTEEFKRLCEIKEERAPINPLDMFWWIKFILLYVSIMLSGSLLWGIYYLIKGAIR